MYISLAIEKLRRFRKLKQTIFQGCLDLTTNTLKDNTGLIIGITMGFIVIQIIGVCLGCVFCQRIARDGYKEV